MKRNPRWKPAVGDCFRIGSPRGVVDRTVLAVTDDRVEFISRGKKFSTPLKRWQEWSVNTRIIKSA